MKSLSRSLKLSFFAAVILAATGFGAPAYAAVMPNGHGMFANNPRICVICHRTHTATNENLLRGEGGFCLTCHSGGTGADTDVASGLYLDSPTDAYTWGVVGGNLLAGGFRAIDVNGDGTLDPMAYPGTSQHDIGVLSTPFGSAGGDSMILECTSCHTIHASFSFVGQYRLLRTSVGDTAGPLTVNWNGPWEGPTQTVPHSAVGYMAYTETDFSRQVDITDPAAVKPDPVDGTKGWTAIEYTRNYRSGLSAWCGGCHGLYGEYYGGGTSKIRHTVEVPLSGSTTPATKLNLSYGAPSSDLPLNDLEGNGRTAADTLSCMTCHKAHGTSAIMDRMGAYTASDRAGLPPLTGSMLLRMNNRGVCVNCHHNLGTSPF